MKSLVGDAIVGEYGHRGAQITRHLSYPWFDIEGPRRDSSLKENSIRGISQTNIHHRDATTTSFPVAYRASKFFAALTRRHETFAEKNKDKRIIGQSRGDTPDENSIHVGNTREIFLRKYAEEKPCAYFFDWLYLYLYIIYIYIYKTLRRARSMVNAKVNVKGERRLTVKNADHLARTFINYKHHMSSIDTSPSTFFLVLYSQRNISQHSSRII